MEEGSWDPQEEGKEGLLEQGCKTVSPSPEVRDVDKISLQALHQASQCILQLRVCLQPILKMGRLSQGLL